MTNYNSQKRIIITNIGTVLEWAEFTYYAYIASEIAALFFPRVDKRTGILAVFTVFAVGYIIRPLGSIVFGYIGDRFGRRTALQLSVLLIGIASFLIGCLPTYNAIGISSPILLLVFRCLQGFSVAGEFNGSAIFLIEHSKKNPCLAGSWTGCSAAFGMAIGSLVAAIIALPTMPSWGWRIPFIISALTCFYGVYLRRHVNETPEFLAIKAKNKTSLLNLLSNIVQTHRDNFLLTILLASVLGIYIYTMNVYYVSYLIQTTTLTSPQAKIIATFGNVITVFMTPLAGFLADKYSPKRIMVLGFSLFFISAPTVFIVAKTNSFWLILNGQWIFALCNGFFAGPYFKFINDLFPPTVRYSAISLGWNIGIALFGGTAPIIANYLQQITHLQIAPALYVMLAGLIALIALHFISSKKGRKVHKIDFYGPFIEKHVDKI